METKVMYQVTVSTATVGTNLKTYDTIGIFSDKKDAIKALNKVYKRAMDYLEITKLGDGCYREEDEFEICDVNEKQFVSGVVDEYIVGKEYCPTDFDVICKLKEEKKAEAQGKYKKVKSADELAGFAEEHANAGEEPVEVILMLNHGAYTRHSITLANEDDENGLPKYEVYHFSDNTTEILTYDDLYNPQKTNLALGIERGALYYVLN